MSEERRLNEVEELLRSLTPAALAVDRDALFFRAGLAAAGPSPRRRLIWPAIAASLVVACGGLGLAYHEKSTQLDVLLAAATPAAASPAAAIADNDTPSAAEETGASVDETPRFGRRNAPRDFERMFRLADTRGGRLTALGWVAGQAADEPPSVEPPVRSRQLPERPIRRFDSWQLLDGHGG